MCPTTANGSLTATDLTQALGLDAGYLSRILKRFEADGLLTRAPSARDGRQVELALTRAGRDAFQPLDTTSREEISAMLATLSGGERADLLGAMGRVSTLLGDPAAPEPACTLRAHRPGDIGWVIHRQSVLYVREYGWDGTFEALVLEIGAAFLKSFNPAREQCWIAERSGDIVGSVLVMAASETTAKLRMLYVEPQARGLGIGGRLVDECIRFARDAGYDELVLWTNDVLIAARRLYQAAGFKLVAEERHHSFGKDLLGQNWAFRL